ncbi:hypothetical protein OAB20_06360, partial [Winogradskyella sp.]|nr:hypothetical protein [Winogradskyella sp.]
SQNIKDSNDSVKDENYEMYERIMVFSSIEAFTKELVKNNIKLNKKNNSDLIEVEIQFSNFSEKYGIELKNTVAIALGSNIDNIIKIDINKKMWNTLTDVEKLSTIFHEVCHDVLNVRHIEGDRLNLMHPYFQPKNYNELQIMTEKFIRDYKMGRVETFEKGFFIHDFTKNNMPYLKILK